MVSPKSGRSRQYILGVMSVLSDCVRTLTELMSTVTVMFIDDIKAMQRKVEASWGMVPRGR